MRQLAALGMLLVLLLTGTAFAADAPDFELDNLEGDEVSLADLLKEFSHVCQANIIFFRNLSEEAWERTGTVNDHPASVRAIAYNMVNHVRHHLDGLRSHYLS